MIVATALLFQRAPIARLPPVLGCAYSGPTADAGVQDLECSLTGPGGLILEVARSTIADDAGRGLFVRVPDGEASITLPGGTALCGYGSGSMCAERPERARGRYTEYRLIGCATVWFEGELTNACELLQRDDIERIAGHEAVRNANGELQSIRAEEEYADRYFVPSEQAVDGAQLDASSVGIMANDLAGGFTDLYERGGYDAASVPTAGLQCWTSRLLPSNPGLAACRLPVAMLARSSLPPSLLAAAFAPR